MRTPESSGFRFVARGLAALLALGAAAAASAQTSYKQTSFHEVQVFSGLVNPTAVRFLPDGSVIVAEKSGLIKKFDSLTATTPTIVADLRVKVHNFWDRGLLGLAIDPNFTTNHYVYVLYANNALPGGTPPKWVATGGDPTSDPCPTPPGATTDGCVVTGHLSRLLAVGTDWTASEQNFIEDWCQQFPSHSVGSLAFGADGMLYVTGGEGASFDNADWGQFGGTQGTPPVTPANPCGDPPFPAGTAQTKPTAEGGALRSQSPRRTAGEPRVLSGSLLRLDPATGAAAPGNPMIGSNDLDEKRIIAYGFRNPFRMIIKPGTNDVWIGDVGWSTWEEINRVPDHTVARNYGWPCFEGNGAQYTGLNICPTQGQTIAPYFTYNHNAQVLPNDGCSTGSSSVAGMAFYGGGSNYPASYNNALFFSDYSRRCMWVMLPGTGGDPNPANIIPFASNAAGPVELQIGPDGNVYYSDFDGGKIWRIEYGPIAVASANPLGGPLPLTVNFSSAGSMPAQSGDTITYAWDLDGDGQYDDSTAANPSFTYTTSTPVTVRLKVTDNHGASSLSNPIQISPNNSAPSPTITTPASTLTWKVGDTINFAGSAVDPEEGPLPPSALSWSVIIHHCPSNCHTHLYQTFSGVASGSFPAPDHEYPSYLEIQLVATDSGGLQGTTSVNIQPQTVNFNLQSVPVGLQLSAGTTTAQAPFVHTVIVNSQTGLIAPSPQGSSVFSSWSDGGAASHTVTAGTTDATYTATYVQGGNLPAPWIDEDIGSPGVPGNALYNDGVFTVSGGGADIEGTSDQFNFVYQPMSGNITVIARVASIQPTSDWAKGGVMIRETLAPNSRHCMMVLTSGNGLAFQRRTVTGGTTQHTGGALVAAPYWVKLTRVGNTFTGYGSPDGVTWTLVGTDTIAMAGNVSVGMPVTSHWNAVTGSDTFDSVSAAGVTNQLPTVSITSPANNATFTAPANITINATASDTDGTVSKVDFYQNGSFLGTDATSPYSFAWNGVAAGNYALTAIATDNSGGTGTSTPVNIVVNPSSNNPPTVSITSPTNGATFTAPANVTINATASDSDGTVTKVDFYQNGILLGTDTTSPYSFAWNNVAAGNYALTAIATDNGGATRTSATVNIVVNTAGGGLPPPWLDADIGSPGVAGSATWAGGVFTIKGGGSDIWNGSDQFHFVYQPMSGNITVIAQVTSIQPTDFWAKGGVMIRETLAANSRHAMMALTSANGVSFQRRLATGGTSTSTTVAGPVAPYWVKLTRTSNTFNAYSSPDGTAWTLVGTDTIAMANSVFVGMPVTSHYNLVVGTDTFANVSATGVGNALPTVSITSPANNATFTAPANITINATASDTDGTVSKVDFYQNGSFLGTDATSPYSFAWNGVAAGNYALTAIATDNAGGTGTSTPVNIVVNPSSNNPPTVSITSPANNATFTAPANITINATASDTDGSVTKVDFYQNGVFLGTDATSPYSFAWNGVAAGNYALTAVATDNGGATTTSTPVNIVVNTAGGGLPPPWVDADIGSPGVAGSATWAGGVFTIKGGGSDIWNASDQFHYVYQPMSANNITIIARVASVEGTDFWAKGGVMIRETLAANSRHAMMAVTSANGAVFQRRIATGGSSSNTNGPLIAAPYWVKLVRQGTLFSGYASPDGVTWTLVGTDTITMTTSVFVGLPVTSHWNAVVGTDTFDGVTVTSP